MALALLGMSATEIDEFAGQIAEIAANQVELAMENHEGSYMRCQGYTGKKGVMGWIGFGFDLFNPADDIALLSDINVLISFNPLVESPEDYAQRKWDEFLLYRSFNRPVFVLPF